MHLYHILTLVQTVNSSFKITIVKKLWRAVIRSTWARVTMALQAVNVTSTVFQPNVLPKSPKKVNEWLFTYSTTVIIRSWFISIGSMSSVSTTLQSRNHCHLSTLPCHWQQLINMLKQVHCSKQRKTESVQKAKVSKVDWSHLADTWSDEVSINPIHFSDYWICTV